MIFALSLPEFEGQKFRVNFQKSYLSEGEVKLDVEVMSPLPGGKFEWRSFSTGTPLELLSQFGGFVEHCLKKLPFPHQMGIFTHYIDCLNSTMKG